MARQIALATCVVIVHLLLIHSLHLMTGHGAAAAHHAPMSSIGTNDSGPTVDPSGGDANCAAPSFVGQRLDILVAFVDSGTVAEIVPDDRPSSSAIQASCDLPRLPGPDRQAILQRFTL